MPLTVGLDYGEAVRLVKEAWGSGYMGLAVLLAVAGTASCRPWTHASYGWATCGAIRSAPGLRLLGPRPGVKP